MLLFAENVALRTQYRPPNAVVVADLTFAQRNARKVNSLEYPWAGGLVAMTHTCRIARMHQAALTRRRPGVQSSPRPP